MSARQPWEIPGPSTAPERPGLLDALRRLHLAARRPPTEADAPPPSTLPLTPAAKVALRMSGAKAPSKRRTP